MTQQSRNQEAPVFLPGGPHVTVTGPNSQCVRVWTFYD